MDRGAITAKFAERDAPVPRAPHLAVRVLRRRRLPPRPEWPAHAPEGLLDAWAARGRAVLQDVRERVLPAPSPPPAEPSAPTAEPSSPPPPPPSPLLPSCRRTPIPRRRCLPRHCCPSCRRTPIPRRRRRRRFPRCQGRRLAESLAARGVQPCICALCRGSVTSGGARAPRDRTLFSGATVVALYLKIDSSCFCFILRVQRWLQLEPVLPASPRSGGFRWTDSCQAALTERKERPQCLIFTGNTPTDNLLGGSPNNLRVVFTGIGYHP